MQGKQITLDDKTFHLYITETQIITAVRDIAERINAQYIGRRPLIIPILNGSFMFASDLAKNLTIDCEFSFIKASSYKGSSSTGILTALIGVNEEIEGRDVIIIEDIIDTGHTLAKILPSMLALNPSSIKIATLLYKPNAIKTELKIDYVGIEIPNEFIVGYGLDYNGLGRNLKEIYQVEAK